MTDITVNNAAGHNDHEEHEHDYAGDTMLGFWIYIMSDCMLFASLFATFAVLSGSFAGQITYEFWHFSHEGAAPQTSAYWSAFYALLATHGLHVFCGMIWMIILVVHILKNGLTETNQTRLSCLSLFWHFLDIIWICVFSLVYLLGVM